MLKNFQSISFVVLSFLAIFPALVYGPLGLFEGMVGGVFLAPLLVLIAQTRPSWIPTVINTLAAITALVVISNMIFGELWWDIYV